MFFVVAMNHPVDAEDVHLEKRIQMKQLHASMSFMLLSSKNRKGWV